MTQEFKGKTYNDRHGGAFDRGSADSYYRRQFRPHYYVGNTGQSEAVTETQMTAEEIAEYRAGYDYNESVGDFKDWS